MSIDYDKLAELLDTATPGPWRAIPNYDDGEPRPDDSCLIKVGDEYLGIMHGPDADLTALAPDMARELLRLRRDLTDLRDLMYTHAGYQRKDGYSTAADWTENHAYRLTRIIQGDTK